MQKYRFFKIIVIVIACVCNLDKVEAQVLLCTRHNSPIEGHAICKQKILSAITLSNKIINLTKVDVLPERQNVVYFKELTTGKDDVILSCLDGDKVKKFSMDADTLFLKSIENNQGKVLYSGKGIPYMLSFGLGDKLSFQNKEEHNYVDKISYKGEDHGSMTLQDGFSIITPEGDTLKEVTDLQTEINVKLCIKNQVMEDVKQYHRYFAKGYRYPIIEIQKERIRGQDSYEAYYFPKEPLEQLSGDWDNKALRDRLHDTDVSSKQDKPFFYYELGKYDVSKGFIVKCKSQDECKVRLVLATLGGIVVFQKNVICPKNTECSFVLDIPGLGTGTYVLYLNNDNKVISETVNVR